MKIVERDSATLDATVNDGDFSSVAGQKPVLMLRWLFPDATRPAVPVLKDFALGRDPSCLVNLDGERVSRVHAEVKREGEHFSVRDNGSTNGTYVGGQTIVSARIGHGSVLRIGNWVGVFEQSARGVLREAGFADVGPNMGGGGALSVAMEPARRAAQSNLPIIVCGETGTGKEVASRAIHAWSGRSGEFCAINCAALPRELVEGELFGYRRGAFTGADRNNPGYFRRAHQGTLLLDEINELELGTQAKLLRVLQEQEVTPLGESQAVKVDVRMIVAAQAPLDKAVAAGRFREDLYMRLRGLEITLPPLRARVADVPALFQRFLATHAQGPVPPLEAKLVEALCLYPWPGNVRELELIARRLLAVHGSEPLLKRTFLPEHVLAGPARQSGGEGTAPEGDLPRLRAALRRAGGNLSKACAEIGISRQRAYRLLDGLAVKDFLAQSDKEE